MYDFIRAASIVPKLEVGNTEFNTDEILKGIKKAEKADADIAVFPELAVTGYTCADLFFQQKLIRAVKCAVARICEEKFTLTAIVGAPLEISGQLYNAALIICGGRIRGIVPKTFLPNYNEFYEKRWFSESTDLKRKTVKSRELGLKDDYEIPVGRDLIFNIADEVRFGVEVCEDLWTAIPPSGFLAVGGAELIVNLSASNETISKRRYRRELVAQQSARCIAGYIYTSSGEGESTTDLVFSGHTVIAENGTVIAENEASADGDYMIVQDIDCGKIKADRLKIKTFKDCAAAYGADESFREIDIDMPIRGDGTLYDIKKLPFVPTVKRDRLERCMDIFSMQVAGLKKRLKVTGCKPVIGVSGGLDSTLAILVAAKTVKELGKDASEVIGITMPCFGTSERTHDNSWELMKTLGITAKEINIKEACRLHFKDIGHDGKTLDLTYENVQARERTQVLMDYAGKVGGLVVGTGDLSELALGWCTYNADHMSMYGVNCGVPKTLVRWMIDSIMQNDIFRGSGAVLRDILDTPISPELLPPDADGKIAQQTEEIVGPYALHDFFLYYTVRFGFTPEKVYALARRAFREDFDGKTVKKWLIIFYRRFFTQQFKRSCLPDGVKIGSICLSPRGDWRCPSDAASAAWVARAEAIEV
ncbi:MAG: NAD(+) synthase [Eubacteriales bacterium]|nr:NAD(+) synthase [Eubacteriales bacterium]